MSEENRYAVMPYSDYQETCDAVREQTGTSDLIKSRDMASMIRSIKGSGEETTSGAVRYDIAQSLTDEQKAQVRENIGAQATLTEADKAEIINSVIESLGGTPVFGVVDENNNIILTSALTDGTYSIKYEMTDGTTVDIGELSFAADEPDASTYTNLLPLSVNADGSAYVGTNGEDGYKSGYKISTSSGNESATSGAYVSGFIPIENIEHYIRIKNITVSSAASINNIVFYDSNKTRLNGYAGTAGAFTSNVSVNNGVYSFRTSEWLASAAFFRFSCGGISAETIVTENEEINEVEPTNFADPNTTNTTDWSIWCNNARFGSDGTYRSNSGTVVTNYVPIQVGDTLYFEGLNVATTGTSMTNGLAFYDGEKDIIAPSYLSWYIDEEDYATLDVTDGAYTIEILDAFSSYINGTYGGKGSETAFVRIAGALTGTVNDVVIKVKRNGKWL